VCLGAGEKADGVSPDTGELVARGGVQKELFAPMRGASGSESRKKRGGSTQVGGLGQGVALDGTIAAAIDIGLTRHDKEGRRRVCSEGARNYGTKQRWDVYNKKGKRRSPQGKASKFVGRRANFEEEYKFGEKVEVNRVCYEGGGAGVLSTKTKGLSNLWPEKDT